MTRAETEARLDALEAAQRTMAADIRFLLDTMCAIGEELGVTTGKAGDLEEGFRIGRQGAHDRPPARHLKVVRARQR